MLPATYAVDVMKMHYRSASIHNGNEMVPLSNPQTSRWTVSKIDTSVCSNDNVRSIANDRFFHPFPIIEWCSDNEDDNGGGCSYLWKQHELSKHLSIGMYSSSPTCQLRRSKSIQFRLYKLQDSSCTNRSNETFGESRAFEPLRNHFRIPSSTSLVVDKAKTTMKHELSFESSVGIMT